MYLRSFRHTGLRRLYLDGKPTGVPTFAVEKLRRTFAFLESMDSAEELRTLPTWNAHRLTGDRRGTWALHVTANWRVTFLIANNELREINLEDYH